MYMNTNCDLLFLASVLNAAVDFKTYDKSFVLVSNIFRSVMNMKLMKYFMCLFQYAAICEVRLNVFKFINI